MMKLMTVFELAVRSDTELQAIAKDAFNELARSEEHSADRHNALATLENVRRVMRSRMPRP
ncbi:hypothetical protein [Marinobacterium sedimentorum]|uniref:hypothetical protein n=1 Tax=Marinobacterium sedimentorum TaxID=2927804 RepID=UPI0020C71EB0|nr:hypothetical protein [Marinobacterium sedimentorum]MCP8685957.1 hypothetical protein [Marinobacterium sedimentorum]